MVPAVKEIISTVMERNPAPIVQAVPLSDKPTTVKRRIDEMNENTEEQLCEVLRKTSFSVQLDETTTSDNNALLMDYVRYIAHGKLWRSFYCASMWKQIVKVKQYDKL